MAPKFAISKAFMTSKPKFTLNSVVKNLYDRFLQYNFVTYLLFVLMQQELDWVKPSLGFLKIHILISLVCQTASQKSVCISTVRQQGTVPQCRFSCFGFFFKQMLRRFLVLCQVPINCFSRGQSGLRLSELTPSLQRELNNVFSN